MDETQDWRVRSVELTGGKGENPNYWGTVRRHRWEKVPKLWQMKDFGVGPRLRNVTSEGVVGWVGSIGL